MLCRIHSFVFSLIKRKIMIEKLFSSPNQNLMVAKGMPKWSRLGVDQIRNSKITKMAKTASGKKKVYVKGYTYTNSKGKRVKVPTHYRSTNE